jgi:hypothetical protein
VCLSTWRSIVSLFLQYVRSVSRFCHVIAMVAAQRQSHSNLSIMRLMGISLQAFDLAPTSGPLQRKVSNLLMKGHMIPVCLAKQSVDLEVEPHSQLAMAEIDLEVCCC